MNLINEKLESNANMLTFYRDKVAELEKKNAELEKENAELKEANAKLEKENDELKLALMN